MYVIHTVCKANLVLFDQCVNSSIKFHAMQVIDFLAELGTRKHCRHNETMSSGPNMVDYCIMSVFVVAIQYSIYTPTNYCLYLFLNTEALAEL